MKDVASTEPTPVKREKLYSIILNILNDDKRLTAKEVAREMLHKHHILNGTRQDAAPRLTELVALDKVSVVDKKFDKETKKYVSVYALRKENKK